MFSTFIMGKRSEHLWGGLEELWVLVCMFKKRRRSHGGMSAGKPSRPNRRMFRLSGLARRAGAIMTHWPSMGNNAGEAKWPE